MSKKMVLLSLLVSTTVLTTSIKAEGVTVTNSSDVATTQDVELLTPSDGSMNVFMEEPQTETSTSATDMSNSDATMSSSVSEVIVDTVEETTPTETEVMVSEEEKEDVTISKEEVVPDQVPTTTHVTEETTVSMPVGTLTDLRQKPVGTLTALQMLPETSGVSSKTSVVVGVVLAFFGLIGSLYMYAKRIFG